MFKKYVSLNLTLKTEVAYEKKCISFTVNSQGNKTYNIMFFKVEAKVIFC